MARIERADTGPGRSSACAADGDAARCDSQAADLLAREHDRAGCRDRAGAGSSCRAWICRSPIRRPGPTVSARATSKLTPSTARTVPPETRNDFTRSRDREQRLGREVAGDIASSQGRHRRQADCLRLRAARREGAARRHVVERRHEAGDLRELATRPAGLAGMRRRLQQALRVGMLRLAQHFSHRRRSRRCGRHTSRRRGSARLGDHGEVVRDQDHAPCRARPAAGAAERGSAPAR